MSRLASNKQKLLALVAVAVAAVFVIAPASASSPAGRGHGHGHGHAARDVSANLFEWNWPAVANECTSVLGPAGYGSVQVAPPQDSLKRTALGNGSDTILHPWWEVYQPVDYNLTSRMGSESQFRSMVTACRHAGVKVIVDTVINHMTGQGNTSYGGVTYTKYNYTGLYSPADFHSYPGDCPVPPDNGSGSQEGSIQDFNDYTQVFNCELVGLSDLRTQSSHVRHTLAKYLNKLLRYGVSGFRIDAAKHMGVTDLAAIEARLHRTVDGTRPFVALEVMPGSPGEISPTAFEHVGDLLGFDYAGQLQAAFKSYNHPPNDGNIGGLKVFGADSGLLPSNKELVFVENHDTERNGSTLNYKDPNNTIANEFMLAWPHGTPQVYASFAWNTPDDSPPSDANGMVTNTVCDDTTWVCVDRYTGVRNMVGFHNYVRNERVTNWYDDGANLIAFSRGHRGFFSTNNESAAKTVSVQTGLGKGTYCDIIHGSVQGDGTCSGPTVTVGQHGFASITVGSYDSVAFTARDKVH
jgi:alpha-amylase